MNAIAKSHEPITCIDFDELLARLDAFPNFEAKKQCQKEHYFEEIDPSKSYINQDTIEGPSTIWSNSSKTSSNSSPATDPNSTLFIQSDSQAKRAETFDKRATQRKIIRDIHDSLSYCGLGRVEYNRQKRECEEEVLATVAYERENSRASVLNITHCKSPWSCPVCAPKIAAKRAFILRPQLDELSAQKYVPFLITLTCRHERDAELSALIQKQSKAWKMLTSGRVWKEFKASLDGLEYVSGGDMTQSDRNGWHPHRHVLLMIKTKRGERKKKAYQRKAEFLLKRWIECLASVGLEALPEAQHCVRAKSIAQATTYAVSPASVYEVTAMSKKRAQKANSGLTAFEILDRACEDIKEDRQTSRYIALWRDYVQATKGVRQVTTSRGISLKADEEYDFEEKQKDTHIIAHVDSTCLSILDKKRLTSKLLDMIENSEDDYDRVDNVREFLQEHCGGCLFIIEEVFTYEDYDKHQESAENEGSHEPCKPTLKHRHHWMHKKDPSE